ncbi:uncharacterized protein [Diadema setosum]|uniref:uncharacterized protein n=1 Tax=Diadema setosum TaxID=31175 RepID=UPI003B3B9C3A
MAMYTLEQDVDLMTDMSSFASNVSSDHHRHELWAEVLEITTLAIIMLGAIVANMVAIVTILRVRLLRKNPHNLLILNLMITDLGLAVTSMVFSMVSLFDNGQLLTTHRVLCDFTGFWGVSLSASSFATITCVAIDRYLSVVWSARFPPNHRRSCAMIVAIWVASCTFGSAPLFRLHSSFEYEEDTHHCSPTWDGCFFYVIGFVINYVLTIPVMIVCYFVVFYTIWKKQIKLRAHSTVKTPVSSSFTEKSVEDTGDMTYTPPVSTVGSSGEALSSTVTVPWRQVQMKKSVSLSMSNLADLNTKDEFDSRRDKSRYSDRQGNVTFSNVDFAFTTGYDNGITDDTFAKDRSTIPQRPADKFDARLSNLALKSVSLDVRRGRSSVAPLPGKLGRSKSFFCLSSSRRHPSEAKTTKCQRSASTYHRQRLQGKLYQRAVTKRGTRRIKKRLTKLRADKQVALTGTFLILSSLVCWTPYAVIRSCFIPLTVSHWAGVAAMWISFTNSLLDPLIYALMNRRIKARLKADYRAIRSKFSCCISQRNETKKAGNRDGK